MLADIGIKFNKWGYTFTAYTPKKFCPCMATW